MRKVLMLVVASVTMVLVSAGAAWAQQYPPAPAGAGRGAGAGGGDGLAFTGSNTLPLLAIGLALLVTGAVLVFATRRRAAVRSRSVTKAVA